MKYLLLIAPIFLVGCLFTENGENTCVPGSTQNCVSASGGEGVQTCKHNGSSWDTCVSSGSENLVLDVCSRLNLLDLSAARVMPLDSSKTYELSVADTSGYGNGFTVSHVFFHCDHNLPATENANAMQGIIKPGETITITSATAVYGFLVDDASCSNTGEVRLIVKEEGGLASELLIHAKDNALLTSSAATKFLDGSKTYELSVIGTTKYSENGPPVSHVFYHCYHNLTEPVSYNSLQGVIKPGETVTISNTAILYGFLIDDDAADNADPVKILIK